jgi:sRNA-binding carbon storage regulator CsrA
MEIRRRSRCHRGGRVRLSFEAPPSVIIHREEVAELIAAQAGEEEKPVARPA